MPELDDALPATHFAVESAKVCFAGPRLKASAPAGSPESCFGLPAMELQITAAQKHSVPINTKRAQTEQECVEGLLPVPEANMLSS